MNIRVKSLIDWTIPTYGNSHSIPYGMLLVTDGKTEERCKTKNDLWTDRGRQYIVFNRRRYYVINKGSLITLCWNWSPNIRHSVTASATNGGYIGTVGLNYGRQGETAGFLRNFVISTTLLIGAGVII